MHSEAANANHFGFIAAAWRINGIYRRSEIWVEADKRNGSERWQGDEGHVFGVDARI